MRWHFKWSSASWTPSQIRRRVRELVDRHHTDTYRAVYTVQFQGVIYVLHAFQKKSTKGIKTPKKDMDLIKQRLEAARRHFGERQN